MADITMCKGEECPLKERCYRFLATPETDSEHQTFFMNPPNNGEQCDFFWEVSQSD